MTFVASAGYFGLTPQHGASFAVYVDGELRAQRESIGRDDGIEAEGAPGGPLRPTSVRLPVASGPRGGGILIAVPRPMSRTTP